MKEASTITKVTARPIPVAVSIFLETPKKEHIPRNLDKTKLLINNADINIVNIVILLTLSKEAYYLFDMAFGQSAPQLTQPLNSAILGFGLLDFFIFM